MVGNWIDKLFHLGKTANRSALVVDDDRDIVGLLTLHLTEMGFDVLPSQAAKTALNFVLKRKRRIDLLVLDVRMPNQNGPALAKELRKHRPAATSPILFISGAYSERDLKTLAASFRHSHVLHKPFTTMEFYHAVEEICTPGKNDNRKAS